MAAPVLGALVELLRDPRLRRRLIGASLAWFAFDFAYYGNTVATSSIIKLLKLHATLVDVALLTLLIFAVGALPGYALAIYLDRPPGRRTLQEFGFGMMMLTFALIG